MANMRVLVCGSRDWVDKLKIRERLSKLPPGTVIIHGAYRGADLLADKVAKELGFAVLPFPADWTGRGRRAGPERNTRMIEEGKPELGIAFHPDLANAAGTGDCVGKMRAKGIPVEVIS